MSVFFLEKLIPIVLFSLFLVSSCKEKPIVVDPPTIPEDKMILMLTDIHMAEGIVQVAPREEKDSMAHSSYQAIFKHYNTNEAEFDKNLKSYLSDPVVADRVYTTIIDNLSKLESENKLPNEVKLKADSPPVFTPKNR